MANEKNKFDITELKAKVYEAACAGHDKDIINLIEDIDDENVISGILNHHTDEDGQIVTPLIISAKNGYLSVVNSLLNLPHRIDLEQTGTVEFVRHFLAAGEKCRGVTALWCAVAAQHFDIVRLLVDKGANINHSSINNSSPLRVACLRGNLEIVQFLLNNGANLAIAYMNRYSCLMAACGIGNTDIVKCLIEKGADIDFEGEHGTSAMHTAAQGGQVDIMKLLISNGADMKKNEFSVTPLMTAAACGNAAVAFYIMEHLQITKEEKSDALALLGASFTDKGSEGMVQAYRYMKEALEIRHSNTGQRKEKLDVAPNPIFDNRIECKTLVELANMKNNHIGLHMESLLIRERLLGNDPIMASAIVRKGDYFHKCGMFDKCIKFWIYAMKLNQNLDRPSYHVSRFLAVSKDINMLGSLIEVGTFLEMLRYISFEVGLNQKLLATGEVSPTMDTIAKICGENILVCISIIIRLLEKSETEGDKQNIQKAVYNFINLQPVLQNGFSPLHISCQINTPWIYEFISIPIPHPLLCQTLLACGAKVNAQDWKKNTPLHVIVESMNNVDSTYDMVKGGSLKETFMCLVESGAHVDISNVDGRTPLDVATSVDTKAFIRKNANTNLKCLASRVLRKHRVPFKKYLPSSLQEYVELH